MNEPNRRILVTGAKGFIGKTLCIRLAECPDTTVISFTRDSDVTTLRDIIANVDAVIHLAGENRPSDDSAFMAVNHGLTATICDAILHENTTNGRKVPIVLASSTQASSDNAYGKSKRAAEHAVKALADATGIPATIFRLPGVFGKWCKPNYNSVVATFCHNITRGLPVQINNPDTSLTLVYVDDVVTELLAAIDTTTAGYATANVAPEYTITLGDLATQINTYEAGRDLLNIGRVGTGLQRALYATYVSYLPSDRFVYDIPQHADDRGVFVEVLKTADSGQFSFFSAAPGITRGGHYHHTKTEKFMVIRGDALFRFRHIVTNERVEIRTSGVKSQIVETIPGWSHDITNVGNEELLVMLWANEVFDRDLPDTIYSKV